MSEMSGTFTADAIGPPVPIPDVPGADAGAEGLPSRSVLSARQRILVESSAIADVALRTAVASVLSATVTPAVRQRTTSRQRRQRAQQPELLRRTCGSA